MMDDAGSNEPIAPPRLHESAATSALREAIVAGRADLPSDRRVRAVMAASIAAAGTGVGAVTAAAAGASIKLKLVWAAAAVVAGAAGGGVVATWSGSQRPAPPPMVTPAAPSPVPVETSVPSPEPIQTEPARPLPARRVRTAPALHAAPAPRVAPVDPSSSLLEEARLLEAARAQVDADPNEALRLLARHRVAHPAGALVQEADVVRVQALVRAGRSAEAMREAAEFARRHPGSPHRRRVETLVGADR